MSPLSVEKRAAARPQARPAVVARRAEPAAAARTPGPAAGGARAGQAEILFVPYDVCRTPDRRWHYRMYDAVTRILSPRWTRCVLRVDGHIYMMTRDGWRRFRGDLYDAYPLQAAPVSSPLIADLATSRAPIAFMHTRLTVRQCVRAIVAPGRFDHCSSAVGRLVGKPTRSPYGLYRWMRRRGFVFEPAGSATPATAG